jgi:hypothetical protein
LLRFAAAAEILETDFWVQYNELGGVQDSEVPGSSGSPIYTAKLQNLDSDFPQYIHDNTDDETMHFQTWADKAGNAPPLTDPTNGLVFPDLNSAPFGGEGFQTNLIMPEPCPFLSRKLPVVSIIRPTETKGVAMGALKFLTAMGLFIGQTPEFFALMQDLAEDADEARRGGV